MENNLTIQETLKKKIKDKIKEEFTNLVPDEMWEQLASHINNCYDKMADAGFKKKLYALVIDNELRGITTKNFDFLDHQLIVKQIASPSLSNSHFFTACKSANFVEPQMHTIVGFFILNKLPQFYL